jgi:hypothetical protein
MQLGNFRLVNLSQVDDVKHHSIVLIQTELPVGATLLGTILSSDKTTISAMVGDRMAHPLLISLANIKMDYRSKASHHSYMLLALLPVPHFIEKDKKIKGVLDARLMHDCLDYILAPLKNAATVGVMMNDPHGISRWCFTPLAAYIVDTPEAAMIAGVGTKTSYLTNATHEKFGDAFQHPPRTASATLTRLHHLSSLADPVRDLKLYIKYAKECRLSGVHQPFWRDWPQSEPCRFLNIEVLHHLHKFSFDHDLKWCIEVLGDDEIDFRFSVLHPHTAYRHFKEGISKLKQVTGRQHRDIQRHLVGVITGTAPKKFVISLRALQEFRYYVQAPVIDERICGKLAAVLQTFHRHKDAILKAGARTGKGGQLIDNWYIPKLELLQSAVTQIRENGALIQWSADITEHAHIEVIKDPAKAGNNQNHEEQICRTLDRRDRCLRFNLATSMIERDQANSQQLPHPPDDIEDGDMSDTQSTDENKLSDDIPAELPLVFKHPRTRMDYFRKAQDHTAASTDNFPPRTFVSSSTAFHLTRKAPFKHMTLQEASDKFKLLDLVPALKYFQLRLETGNQNSLYAVGGRRPSVDGVILPFEKVEVWTSVLLQVKDYHHPEIVRDPERLNALPPNKEWPEGRYDIAFANTDPNFVWPCSDLSGLSTYYDTIMYDWM